MQVKIIAIFALICVVISTAAVDGLRPRNSRSLLSPILNVSQIIESYGYSCEQHWVETQDGFILSLQRIPAHGKPVVFLQHGVLDSANTWVMNSPSESLAFILADAGYDVWIGNARGNGYSMMNVNYTISDKRFWAFSWDEMAQYDLPASVEYVIAHTGVASVSYVGHSQGTTVAFAALASNPTFAAHINHFVGLAPVVHVNHQSSLMLEVLAKLHVDAIFTLFGVTDFLPSMSLMQHLIPGLCDLLPIACEFPACAFAGCDFNDVNKTQLAFYFAHFPMPTSVQNIVHWAQMARTGVFGKYDFGSNSANTQHYGQPTPPVYDVTQIMTPISLFNGGVDVLADPTDVNNLLPLLKSLKDHYFFADYGHLDFVWGDNVSVAVYDVIVKILEGVHR